MEFSELSEVLKYRAHRIITKRIEPYDVIESVKKLCNVEEFTFNGRNKFDVLEEFITELENVSNRTAAIGLYMKNVNKFYLAVVKDNPENKSDIELLHRFLIESEYGFSEDDEIHCREITYSDDTEFALEQIDMGKAEVSFLVSLKARKM